MSSSYQAPFKATDKTKVTLNPRFTKLFYKLNGWQLTGLRH